MKRQNLDHISSDQNSAPKWIGYANEGPIHVLVIVGDFQFNNVTAKSSVYSGFYYGTRLRRSLEEFLPQPRVGENCPPLREFFSLYLRNPAILWQ